MKLQFVFISDMHFTSKCVDTTIVSRIVDIIQPFGNVDEIFIVLGGDLTFSGNKDEYTAVDYFLETLCENIRKNTKFAKKINIYCVPGNHDLLINSSEKMDANGLNKIKDNKAYDLILDNQLLELNNFYNFSNKYNCFDINKIIDIKQIHFNDFTIELDLINSAPFSLISANDNGLHYLDDDSFKLLEKDNNSDFVIMISHHPIDCFLDDQKNHLKEIISKKANVYYSAHEHSPNVEEIASANGKTLYQYSGAFYDNNWNSSTFSIGLIDTDSKIYKVKNFIYNSKSNIYVQNSSYDHNFNSVSSLLKCEEQFIKELFETERFNSIDSFNLNYVFPRVKSESNSLENDSKIISDFSEFMDCIYNNKRIVISGVSKSGKTALSKAIFSELIKKKIVLYCDALKLSTKLPQTIMNESFIEIYGCNYDNHYFENCNVNSKAIIIDNANYIKNGKIAKLFKYLNEHFDIIVLITDNTVNFDIIEEISEKFENELIFYKYKITPLQDDKRKQLIKNVICNYHDLDNANNYDVENINNNIKLLKKHVQFFAPFIIEYVDYCYKNTNIIDTNDSSIYSKVFEAKITNSISNNIINNINVDKMYLLFSEIAYYSHINKKIVLTEDEIYKIIEKYNDSHYKTNSKSRVSSLDFINIGLKSNILKRDCNNNGYQFIDYDYHSYFVATKINAKFKEDGKYDDLCYIINNAAQDINESILMFLIYITGEVRILEYIYNSAESMTAKWEELDFNKLPEYMTEQVNNGDKLNYSETIDEYENRIVSNEINDENLIIVKDIYSYTETDNESAIYQLLRATSLLTTISKCLPSFEHNMSFEQKEKFVELIYKMPNRIINYWMNIIENNKVDIINEYLISRGYEEYLERKKYLNKGVTVEKIQDGYSFIREYSLFLLLEIYDVSASFSTKDNTIELLNEYDYECKDTYKLQHLLQLKKVNKYDKMVKESIDYSNEFIDYLPRFLCAKIITSILPMINNRTDLCNKIFDKFIKEDKRKSYKKEILREQLIYKSE